MPLKSSIQWLYFTKDLVTLRDTCNLVICFIYSLLP